MVVLYRSTSGRTCKGWCQWLCWHLTPPRRRAADPETEALRLRFNELHENFDGLVALQPPRNFREYFKTLSAIGEGGFGTVFRVEPTALALQTLPGLEAGTVYAVKCCNWPERGEDIEEIERSFLQVSRGRQVEFFNAMRHRNAGEHFLVRNICNIVEIPRGLYFVLDLLEGPDLLDFMCARDSSVSEHEAAQLARQMLMALEYMHRVAGALHRDVKLENFGFARPVTPGGPLPALKLFDLGLVWVLPEPITPATASRLLRLRPCGTVQYVAPEVWAGMSGPPSDVWGVGLVLHILLTRNLPFGLVGCRTYREAVAVLTQGRLSFDEALWATASQPAREFVESMVKLDPKARSTTQAALEAEWLRNPGSGPGSFIATPVSNLPRRSERCEGDFWKSLARGSMAMSSVPATVSMTAREGT